MAPVTYAVTTLFGPLFGAQRAGPNCQLEGLAGDLEQSRQEMAVAWARAVLGERKRQGGFGGCVGGEVKCTCYKLQRGQGNEESGKTKIFSSSQKQLLELDETGSGLRVFTSSVLARFSVSHCFFSLSSS